MAKTPESPNPNPNPALGTNPATTPGDASTAKGNGGPPQATSGESRDIKDVREPKDTKDARERETREAARGESRESRESRPAAPQDAGTGKSDKRNLAKRKGQFLIAARKSPGMQTMGLHPLQFNLIEQTLRSSPDIEIVDTVGPKNIVGALADGMNEVPSVLVAKMDDQKANMLHQQAQGRLIVERDQALTLADTEFQQPMMVACSTPTTGQALNSSFIVLGKDEAPLAEAEVYLFGSLIPATAKTDERGRVDLSLFGETPQSIRGLYVKPKADYWSFYQADPDISVDEPNVIGLRPLSDFPSLANFPQKQAYGWGQKAMRLDQLPENYRGQGVRIAVIDSGAANSHEDLKKIQFGFDIINKKTNPDTWNEDTIAHGSHCAGVIAGANNAVGIRGFAPDAEVHACKLFPGGQVSQLIDALEYCIEKQIDVINLSLGGAEPSEALEQQILRAKRAGIACIVAAGNSGTSVQYPASSPNVLAVAAIGNINEFPPDSYHTQTLTRLMDANGFFSPKFTCFGPQIAVCAPGVAIASSVPENNYAVWDGTSMAAPHISGLAALVFAHHPDFQTIFKARSADRVERLFQIIKASARPINLGDPSRTGFGLPDVIVAVGLQPQMGMPTGMLQHAIGSVQQPPMLGAASGGAQLGGLMASQGEAFSPASVNPMLSALVDQAQRAAQVQLAQASWINPWAQLGQSMGAQQSFVGGLDPAYAAYLPTFLARSSALGVPLGFGMNQPSFGLAGW